MERDNLEDMWVLNALVSSLITGQSGEAEEELMWKDWL